MLYYDIFDSLTTDPRGKGWIPEKNSEIESYIFYLSEIAEEGHIEVHRGG